MTAADLVIALARCLNLMGLSVLAGNLFFGLVLFPVQEAENHKRQDFSRDWLRLCIWSLLLSVVGLLVWIPIQTAALTGENRSVEVLRSLPSVLFGTAYGKAALLRATLLVTIGLLLWPAARFVWIRALALPLALCALLLQLRMGHPAAAENIALPVAVGAHLVAAALWFGSLPPLFALLRRSPHDGLKVARKFSAYGMAFVLILLCGAVVAGWFLAGGVPGLAGTIYGNIILAKNILFLSMLAVAALNRFRFSRDSASGIGLKYALIVETGLGAAAFVAASLLATQPPGAHEDALWPFAWRLRENILGDAFLMDTALRSIKPFALTALIITGGIFFPKWRWIVLAAGVSTPFILAQPLRLNLFLEEANPASFLHSSTGYTTSTIARGSISFQDHCSSCHGEDGRGRGPLATGNPAWPPDLTAPLFASQSDGELYWTILKGRVTNNGTLSMPGFGKYLDDKTAWSLVDYIRAIGSARRIGHPAPDGEVPPVHAPQVAIDCNKNDDDPGEPFNAVTLITIEAEVLRAFQVDVSGSLRACTISDRTALEVYALLVRPAGTATLLIDRDGWVRFRWPSPHPANPQALVGAIKKANDTPVTNPENWHH